MNSEMQTSAELERAADAAYTIAVAAKAAWQAADAAWQASREWRNNENEDGYRDEGDPALYAAEKAAWARHAEAQAVLARAMSAAEDWEIAHA